MKRSRLGAVLVGALTFALAIAAAGSATRTQTKDPFVLGLVTSFSSPGDVQAGRQMLRIANLYARDANSRGGINGHPVRLEVGDDQGKPEVGASEVTRVITEKRASAIVGVFLSSVTLAQIEVARRYNVPLIAHYSWADDITKKNYPQVFRIGPYNSLIGILTVPYLRHKKYKKVAILTEDTAYGIGQAQGIKAAAKGNPSINIIQFPSQSPDVTPQLSRLVGTNTDAIIIAASYAARLTVFKQVKEVGLNVDLIAGNDYVTLPDFWPAVGRDGIGVVYPTFYAKTLALTAEGKRFRNIYRRAAKQDPLIWHYYFWDAMNALKFGIRKARTTQPRALVQTLPTVRYQGTTGPVFFTRKRGTVHFNQWESVTQFFKQFTRVGQNDSTARVVYVSRQK